MSSLLEAVGGHSGGVGGVGGGGGGGGGLGGGKAEALTLDPDILTWVLLPIFCVMFMQGVARAFISQILKDPPRPKIDNVKQAQQVQRSARLRQNYHYLPPSAFNGRRNHFVSKVFKEEVKKPTDQPEMPQLPGMPGGGQGQDPFAMMGMMKQNMAMILPNMLLMGWVSYFFAGFVLVKLPFPLTARFKTMLQRGISLSSLDVSYVSSLSWYFLNLFGLRGVFSLVLSDASGADSMARMAKMQMGGGMGGAPNQDMKKLGANERNELEIIQHEYTVNGAEHRLIQSW